MHEVVLKEIPSLDPMDMTAVHAYLQEKVQEFLT